MRNWIIIALILLVVGIIGTGATMGRDGFWNFGTVDIAQNQAVDGTGAKNIILSMESMDVTVVKGPTNEIKASLSGKVSEKFVKSTKLKVVRNGDTVTVGVDAKNGFSFGVSIFNAKLKLELPEQQYDSLALDSGSGNTSITDLAAQTLDVEAGSGNVKFNQLTVGKLSLDIGSGNSTITDVTADTAELDMRSGVITVEKLKARELSAEAGSGDIKLYDVDAELEAKTSSGNIRVEQSAITRPMELSSGSGDVTVNTDARPESVRFKFDGGSGDLRNHWDGAVQSTDDDDEKNVVFGDGGILVSVETGSGNLTIGER